MTRTITPIAPMRTLFKALLVPLLLLPVGFLVTDAGPASVVLTPTGWFIVAIYAGIWLFARPSRFEADGGLSIRFPLWTRRVEASDIISAEVLDMDAFRARYPRPLRVGAGGLWGGFGWLTTKNGWVEFYISRFDGLVLIQRKNAMPLLISPADARALVDSLRTS